MCKVLQVSTSGYYASRKRPTSKRALRHQKLTVLIKASFTESRETYGARRVAQDLRDEGEHVSTNTVALLMRRLGLIPKAIKRFRVTTQSRKTTAVPNLLKQNFSPSKINESWVSDITAIPSREGWLYLCVVIELFSRAVIGWSMSSRIKGELVTKALKMALEKRRLKGPLIMHSDQGAQYASDEYHRILKAHGIQASMSRKGNCWDNAVAESFFHSLKTERTSHENYLTRTQARLSVFDYIEVFYNRRRRHSSLDYQAPMVYELMCS